MVIAMHIYLQYYLILFLLIQIISIISKYFYKKCVYSVNKQALLGKYINKSCDESNDKF